MTTRLGLVGLGAWGRRIASTLQALPGVQLVGIAQRSSVTAVDAVPVWSDWRDMIAGAPLDGIILATPPEPRLEIAQFCVERRLPAYLEKPICLHKADAEALQSLARARDSLLVAGHLHLYAPAFVALKRCLDTAGEIRAIHSIGGNHGPFRDDYRALFDYGPHDVAMVLSLMGGGMPTRIQAHRTATSENRFAEAVAAELTFQNCVADIRCGNLFSGKSRSLTVTTESGDFVYDDLNPAKLVHRTATGHRDLPYDSEPPLAASLRRFADMIHRGVTHDPDFDQAVAGIGILESIAACLDHNPDHNTAPEQN